MKKRIIGGTLYAVIFYLSLITDKIFYIPLCFFLIVGVWEIIRMIKRMTTTSNRVLSIGYLFIYLIYIYSLFHLYRINAMYVVFFCAVVMLNDTFAFLGGKKFGKTKFSKTSPNKTVEGLLSGILIGPIMAILLFMFLSQIFTFDIGFLHTSMAQNYNPVNNIGYLYLLSIVIAFIANLGDLCESFFKRKANIKDSGTIIYGHGGVLDRMDSLIFPMILIMLLFG